MRDEMMTMKSAFEAKLRAAREESEATARRHLTEIQHMQRTQSPFPPAPLTASASAANAMFATAAATSSSSNSTVVVVVEEVIMASEW